MAKRDPTTQAALEALSLVGQLGLVAFLSFGLTFGLGWLLDRLLGTGIFRWLGLILGVVALYWNSARLLRKFWKTPDSE